MIIDIPYVTYQHNMKYPQSPSGVLSYTIPASCRSARNILTAFYTSYSETISTNTNFTLNVDSTSQRVKNGCIGYQYRIGSESYPSFEKTDVKGPLNGQMLSWVQLALDQHGNTIKDCCFKPNEFYAVNKVKVR